MEASVSNPPAKATSSQPSADTSPLDAAVEATIKARQAARKQKEEAGEEGEPREGNELLKAAAGGEKLSEEEVADALEVFFAEEGDEADAGPKVKEMSVNVGDQKHPKRVRFVIQSIDEEVIKRIRKDSTVGSRAQRRRGEAETDENLVARRIVAKATVEPDFKELAQRLGIRTDPADAVLAYFRKFGKTGLILQVSGEILNLSGYDEDDISELDAAGG